MIVPRKYAPSIHAPLARRRALELRIKENPARKGLEMEYLKRSKHKGKEEIIRIVLLMEARETLVGEDGIHGRMSP